MMKTPLSMFVGLAALSLLAIAPLHANTLYVPDPASPSAPQKDSGQNKDTRVGEPLRLPKEDQAAPAQQVQKQQAQEQQAQEQQAQERQAQEQQAQERQAQERQAQEQQAQERQAQERQAQEQQAQEQQAQERQAQERQAQEQQAAGMLPANETPSDGVSLMDIGPQRSDAKGKPLDIPENTEDVGFMDGYWSFDRSFVGADGKVLNAEFAFDKSGKGVATLTDEGNRNYVAKAEASVSDGVLRMRTSPFVNRETGQAYSSTYMECRNVSGDVECGGTDGFAAWEGQRLLGSGSSSTAAKASAAAKVSESERASSAVLPQGDFMELSPDGAELPPSILESAEKASMSRGKSGMGVLEGDWRYSSELARKSDGQSVSLDFHFDQNGKGYSLIQDGSGHPFKASAEVRQMKDGSLRVKTDAYENGSGKGYHPTFMECRKGKNAELRCDVSNGWTRLTGGQLVSKTFLEEQERQSSMEELLPMAPEEASAAQSQESSMEDARAATEAALDEMASVLAEMSEQASEVASRQASSSSSRQSEKASASLVLPKDKEANLAFLEGHWRCNTGLSRTSDNQPVVVEFKFDRQGKGTASVIELSGQKYSASAQASYRKGTLRINTSEFRAPKKRAGYSKSHIECADMGGQALCKGRNGNVRWSGATFVRVR